MLWGYSEGMSNRSSLVTPGVVFAVAVRPHLWGTAIRQISRLAPRHWWRRPPFLPVPPADYLEFRMVTQYGGGHGSNGSARDDIRPVDVVDYLQWCKQWNRSQ